ncbi:MAG: diguanylate cyclase [Deltaproteobacteria bacterium]|nr:diguanylate cyclase [Deltaproteobacteria bacterium]MBK8237113.1 diguanylate cyclase [Deltaproteobacteria bacterium]MBP7286525.1 diguanylate cyclase [Nannocystaceae bacterium]
MTAIARRFYAARRAMVDNWPLLTALACWPLLLSGRLSLGALVRAELAVLSVVTLLATALAWVTLRELVPRTTVRNLAWHELEFGVPLATAVYVCIALAGGPSSFLHPLAYALVSFTLIVHRTRIGITGVLLVTGLLECLLAARIGTAPAWRQGAQHLVFLGFFAAGNRLVLGSLTRRLRSEHARRVDDELSRMRQEAKDFRLIASQLPPESRARRRSDEELRMVHAAVENIHEQVFHSLELLRTALGLHTAVLLWCEANDDDRSGRNLPRLSIKEMASDGELLSETPQLASSGVLTSVLADPKPLRLHALGGRRLPPYYRGPEPVTDLCAVPLLEGNRLRGILCADRIGDRPFGDAELVVLQRAASHILRVVEHERVFNAVERGKYEQEQFYRASELLNSALTLDDVYQKTFAAVKAIVPYDLAVLTSVHGERHRVLAIDAAAHDGDAEAWQQAAARLQALEFDDANSLVAMAVKNRHWMPAGADLVDPDTVVWTGKTRLRNAKSLLVLPLSRGDEVLGAITLASSRPGVFGQALRDMLRVIGHQVGVSLQNARMYQQMEERATTDGLTGLTNHRAFQERLAQLHALVERTEQKYSIILTDIDHFKGINDTYGHPIGDQVLRKVAALFAGRARKVDIVARYGGEEFVLVLPDTDAAGAESFANRLREEVAQTAMASEHGSFNVTISMGIAEYGKDGRDRLELIERADQALYWCKEHGRNRVHRFGAT